MKNFVLKLKGKKPEQDDDTFKGGDLRPSAVSWTTDYCYESATHVYPIQAQSQETLDAKGRSQVLLACSSVGVWLNGPDRARTCWNGL